MTVICHFTTSHVIIITYQVLDLVRKHEIGRDRVGVFLEVTGHRLADGEHAHASRETGDLADDALGAEADVLAKGVLELLEQVPERPLITLLELDEDGSG